MAVKQRPVPTSEDLAKQPVGFGRPRPSNALNKPIDKGLTVPQFYITTPLEDRLTLKSEGLSRRPSIYPFLD